MKTLEEIVSKWNGETKLNVCNVTRIDDTLVYVALNVDGRGNLKYMFSDDPDNAKRILDLRCEDKDSCVYHVDVLMKKVPQLVKLDIVQPCEVDELQIEKMQSHAQVIGYGIYKAVSIDVDDYDIAYVTYRHDLCTKVTYNGRLLPNEIIIRGCVSGVPQQSWDEAGVICM